MSEDWTRTQVEALVSDYFEMLDLEVRGQPFNKAAHNRKVQALTGRVRGAVEHKHENVSAVLLKLGFPYISGYKPLPNYQGLLARVVEQRLAVEHDLAARVEKLVLEGAIPSPVLANPLAVEVSVPRVTKTESATKGKREPRLRAVRPNYLEIEGRNRELGKAGEEFVMNFERERLWRAGKPELSEKVEHVSVTKGDGLGYDIQSFETDGKPRRIEVKTTRFGPMTPFFASRNEVFASEHFVEEYQLYRLYKFLSAPKLFRLGGALSLSCLLVPTTFSASLK